MPKNARAYSRKVNSTDGQDYFKIFTDGSLDSVAEGLAKGGSIEVLTSRFFSKFPYTSDIDAVISRYKGNKVALGMLAFYVAESSLLTGDPSSVLAVAQAFDRPIVRKVAGRLKSAALETVMGNVAAMADNSGDLQSVISLIDQDHVYEILAKLSGEIQAQAAGYILKVAYLTRSSETVKNLARRFDNNILLQKAKSDATGALIDLMRIGDTEYIAARNRGAESKLAVPVNP
ncbi:hypothetical protein HYS31_05675 [Candidatus Woesearchaeota archaeon]|nr:hypothetical protein [Candidatus Woesearchaeota archaeon]